MLRGRVNPDVQALITVNIHSNGDHSNGDHGEPVEAVIDTGFTGHLTLPACTIGRLGLSLVGHNKFKLANGEHSEFQIYNGSVTWHGHPHEVHIVQSECDPLLGMTLLWGSRITVDATTHGEVTIEEPEPGPG